MAPLSGITSPSPVAWDERGVVYAEFLAAFFVVFLLFLSVCQLTLLTSAKVIVNQAASQGARSAAVVLEDSPEHYDGAARGVLSGGGPNPDESIDALMQAFFGHAGAAPSSPELPQQGARMTPIRTAAYAPLLALTPHASAWGKESSVGSAVKSGFLHDLGFAVGYARAATAISVHDEPKASVLAREPLQAGSTVTLRVTYLFHCAIPFVRALLCDSLTTLFPSPPTQASPDLLAQSETPGALREQSHESARFMPLVGEATLPTQDAGYTGRSGE